MEKGEAKSNEVKQEDDMPAYLQMNQDLSNKLSLSEKESQQSKFKLELSISEAIGSEGQCHQNENWLYRLCFLNQMSFRDALMWTHELKLYLQGIKFIRESSLRSIQFSRFQTKQLYYISFPHQSNSVEYLKIRNSEGFIVLMRKIQEKDILRQISRIAKRLGQSQLIVVDQRQRENFIQEFDTNNIHDNLAYISKEGGSFERNKQNKNNHVYKTVKDFMLLCPRRMLKKINEIKLIENMMEIQKQDLSNVEYFYENLAGETNYDWFCLLANIIRSFLTEPDPCNASKVLNLIIEGQSHLVNIAKQYQQLKFQHHPKNGQKKQKCQHCKTNTQVICESCTQITGKQIFLCIPKCFSEYHRQVHSLTKDYRQDVCKKIGYFGNQCTTICNLMMQVASNTQDMESQLMYLRATNAKLVDSFNLVAQRKMELEDEQE